MNDAELAAVAELVGDDLLAQDRTALDEAHANYARAVEQLREATADLPDPAGFDVRWTP